MSTEKEKIQEAIGALGPEYGEDIKKALVGVTEGILERGMLPKDAMGMNSSMVEGIYGHAYRMYNSGQYKEASTLFRLLVMLDPTEPKYMLGMGACQHMAKEYSGAITTYMMVGMIDPANPIPHYHASDCYAKLGVIAASIEELKQTIELCGDQPQYAMIKDRAQLTVQGYEQEQEAPMTSESEQE